MAYSSSGTSHKIIVHHYFVFVCVLLASKLNDVKAWDTSNLLISPYSEKSPSISPPTAQIKYDVFVSFRGGGLDDIRRGFLSHLIKALSRKQIVAFVDTELERGDEISQSLLLAIERSSTSLIIFSKDFASSRWCLEELVKILECRKEYGQVVIPVFYHVDPSDVRHQRKTFADAIAEQEKKYGKTKVKIWRSALEESANLEGFHSSNFGDDANLLEEVVKVLMTRLKHMRQVHSKGLFGIAKPIAHLESLLRRESENDGIIGIWGMGGIGKTTIAEEVFNRLRYEYEGSVFLENVREESMRHGIISLKKNLYSKLLEEDLKIDTRNGLPEYVEKRLGRMKVLIVLDEVNEAEQLEVLIGTREWFGSGSRIIVTSRDRQVLAKEAVDIYEVKPLDFDEALQLFTLNAFKQNHLEIEYRELSKRVINYAKGNPLVLKVLGHLLHGKDKKTWKSRLEKIGKMPNKKVLHIMGLSYDDLDRQTKTMFLDIACFFDGMNLKVNYLESLLKDGDYPVVAGLERLQDIALITISEENVVTMHDIIQEMAWEIVSQESAIDPRNHRRSPNDIYRVLKNDQGTEAIRSITFNFSEAIVKDIQLSSQVFSKMRKLRFLDFYGENQWLRSSRKQRKQLCNL